MNPVAENFDKYHAVEAKCREAHRIIFNLYHANPVHHDVVPSYNALQAWPYIVCAYSGIEQTIKVLLQTNSIRYPDRGSKGHMLDYLFSLLPESEKDIVRECYAIYHSLHTYIDIDTADEFLKAISGGVQSKSGYNDWRYMLMDFESTILTAQIPRNHPSAMIEVWGTLTKILMAKLYGRGLSHVGHRIQDHIGKCIEDSLGIEIDDITNLNAWLNVGTLNAYAEFCLRSAWAIPSTFGLSPGNYMLLKDSLSDMTIRAKTDYDLRLFLNIATSRPIVWNESSARFEY
ncbi:MAG: hypothetical protein OXE50_12690 [Chloroflexi bacterium]|nr:hypothetical protein [Chloroflexota bacterium]